MKTNASKNLLAVVIVGLVACIVVPLFTTSIQGGEGITYELRPEITLPEYRTDTARAIDAYERMMYRFMDLAERNLTGINTEVRNIAKELHSIDRKLTELSVRMARIEGALGIEQFKSPVKKEPEAETSDHASESDL